MEEREEEEEEVYFCAKMLNMRCGGLHTEAIFAGPLSPTQEKVT